MKIKYILFCFIFGLLLNKPVFSPPPPPGKQCTFNLVSPADNTSLDIKGYYNQWVEFTWKQIDCFEPLLSTYKWFLDIINGNFNTPLMTNKSGLQGKDSTIVISYAKIDSAMQAQGVSIGQSMKSKWVVKSYTLNDTFNADTSFRVTFNRGILTKEFQLNSPINGQLIDLRDYTISSYDFKWFNGQFNGKSDLTYNFYLDDTTGNFTNSITVLPADSFGRKLSINISRNKLNSVLDNNGYLDSGLFFTKWIVISNLGDTAEKDFKVIFRRGQTLGIERNISESKVEIWPNPMKVSAKVSISSPNKKIYSLTMFDLNGKEVYSRNEINTNVVIVKPNNLKPGFYFIQLTGKNEQYTSKIIVK